METDVCRELKEENEDYRDYSMKLRKFGVVESKLIPVFVSWLIIDRSHIQILFKRPPYDDFAEDFHLLQSSLISRCILLSGDA